MFSKRFIILQIIFTIAVIFLYLSIQNQPKASNLPVYGEVSDFLLKDQNSKITTLATFKDKVWVADFIFTTCGGICPTMSNAMSNLHKKFANDNDIRMVSISVNPENDTPETLNKYAQRYKVQGDRWIFLTGSRDVIQKLALESFKMGDMKEIVFHSAMFSLVDRHGRIRGYYDGTDQERVKQLSKDLHALRRER